MSQLTFSCLSCNCLGACSCVFKGEFREDVFDHIRREDLPMSLRGPFKCDHCDKMCKTNIYLGSTWNPSTSPVRILSSPQRYHQPLEDQKEYAPLTLLSWVRVPPWISNRTFSCIHHICTKTKVHRQNWSLLCDETKNGVYGSSLILL